MQPYHLWSGCHEQSYQKPCQPSFTQELHLNSGPHPWSLLLLCWSHACAWPFTSLILILTHWLDFLAWSWTCLISVDLPYNHWTVAEPWYHHCSVHLVPKTQVWLDHGPYQPCCCSLLSHLHLRISTVLLLLDTQWLIQWDTIY